MRNQFRHGTLFLYLEGRIDSSNVDSLETQLKEEGLIQNNVDIAFDAKDLTYISSAGLRVLLKVKKKVKRPVSIVNVSDEVCCRNHNDRRYQKILFPHSSLRCEYENRKKEKMYSAIPKLQPLP